jgi:hypothetical protein
MTLVMRQRRPRLFVIDQRAGNEEVLARRINPRKPAVGAALDDERAKRERRERPTCASSNSSHASPDAPSILFVGPRRIAPA